LLVILGISFSFNKMVLLEKENINLYVTMEKWEPG